MISAVVPELLSASRTMTLTFENLIVHNKRVSVVLVVVIVVLSVLLGGVFSYLQSGVSDNPEDVLIADLFMGATIGACLAIIGSLVTYYLGGKLVALSSDALRIEKAQDPTLHNIVEEMSVAAGLPMPQIYVIFDEALNAFASGRDPDHALIGITTGLRKKLNRDELQAVIAHEMAHIRNRDTLLMMLVGVYAGLVVLLADFFWRVSINRFRLGGGGRSADIPVRKHSLWFSSLCFIGALLLCWIAPIVAKLLQLAISREREYLADATAIQLCRNPGALISALKKIALDNDPLDSYNRATEHMFIVNPSPVGKLTGYNEDSIWHTHPPVIKRMARLRALIGERALEEQVS